MRVVSYPGKPSTSLGYITVPHCSQDGLHNLTLLLIHLAVLIHPRHELVVLLLRLHLVWEPLLEEVRKFNIQVSCPRYQFVCPPTNSRRASLTGIRIHDCQLSTQRTLVLFIRLHNDEAADAEDVSAP